MTAEVKIRPATVDDLPAIQEIEDRTFGHERWTPAMFVRLLFARNDRWEGVLLVAEERGKICGYAAGHAVRIGREAECELENLAVVQDRRRRGLGRQLLNHFLDWCGEAGAEQVHLEVRASNIAGLKLYTSAGFVQTGMRPGYYRYPMEDAVLMSLYFRAVTGLRDSG